MYSHIGQYATKFCQFYFVELFLKKACTNSRNLFYNKIVTTTTTLSGINKSYSSRETSEVTSKKLLQTPNIFRSAFFNRLMSITEMLRNKVTIRKYFWNNTPTTNQMKSINEGRTTMHLSERAPGHTFLGTSTASNNHIMARTFTTSSRDNNYDFPILPIPSKTRSLQQLSKTVQPIEQNFMPTTVASTHNKSETVYRRIRNTCKTVVADLIYSFPFNTHSDRPKELVPTLPIRESRNNSVNIITDKVEPKVRNSLWSITDNFSFPNIHRRFEIESLATTKDDNDNTDENTSIAQI